MSCKHNMYTLDCAWCGYHKDPYRAFVDAVDRIQELQSAIRKALSSDSIMAEVVLSSVLDKTEDKE